MTKVLIASYQQGQHSLMGHLKRQNVDLRQTVIIIIVLGKTMDLVYIFLTYLNC